MNNIIILGSGRSGTSMVAGTLANKNLFMGHKLWPPHKESNPKGFFEGPEVNGINETLIAQVIPRRPRYISIIFFRSRLRYLQRWLAQIPVGTNIPSTPEVEAKIKRLIRNQPFCFKDPRFCYTLPVWRPFLKNTVFVCVFRHPAKTATSILKECRERDYLKHLSMSYKRAIKIWTLMYRHVLEIHSREGDWLFIHYDQDFTEEGLNRLEMFSSVNINRSFPELKYNRTVSNRKVPEGTKEIYQTLCNLAEYTNHQSSI